MAILIHLLSIIIALASISKITLGQQYPTWSICPGANGLGNCVNAMSTGDCGSVANVNPVSASVEGLFLFYANDYAGGQEDSAIGRFLFMEKFGVRYFTILNEEIHKVNCIRRVSDQFDYKRSTIMTFGRLEFLTDNNIVIVTDDQGAPGNCVPQPISSLIISGNEEWTIYRADGNGACLRAANTTSFIPGLVRDVRAIGFEINSICALKRGCHSSLMHYIDNYQVEGVLKRSE